MGHRFRWIKRWFVRGVRVDAPVVDRDAFEAGAAPNPPLLDTSPPPPSTENLVRSVVEAQLAELAEGLRLEQQTLREDIAQSISDLRESVRSVESTVRRQLEGISGEIAQLRESLETRLASLQASDERAAQQIASLEAKSGEIVARVRSAREKIGEVELGLSSLATSVSEGLESTQRSFAVLEESTDRRVRELRDSHAQHVASLERSRAEILTIAESSRNRLTACVGEVAEFLDTEILAGVPLSHPIPASDLESPGWRRPIAAARHWLRRGKVLRLRLDRVTERTRALETALGRRGEESRNRSKLLRAAFDEESGWLSALSERLRKEDRERREAAGPHPVAAVRSQVERALQDTSSRNDESSKPERTEENRPAADLKRSGRPRVKTFATTMAN